MITATQLIFAHDKDTYCAYFSLNIQDERLKTFSELNLISPLKRAIEEEGYEIPTPIQAMTIPAALQDRDILGCAQTGTGKTAAFALPILNRLGQTNRKAIPKLPMVLVLAPTRELAIQIGDSFNTYGKHLSLRHAVVYGGVNQGSQVRAMQRGVHVLVATPGRLIDLMNQGFIELSQLEVFVLDEADRMLDMGFLPDLKRIISRLPKQRQSLFFSATMPPKITELSQELLNNPVNVNVTPKETSVERIAQQVIFVERNGKLSKLRNILDGSNVDRAIVFTRTKRGANDLAEKLERNGVTAAAIHGNKSQGARQRALEAFRKKEVKVLVATDVAARGIDIDGVTHVVNYDLPIEPENYVHRIGRTGRAGAEGIAISLCTESEIGELRAIEKLIGIRIPRDPNQPEFKRSSTPSAEKGERSSSATPRTRPAKKRRSPKKSTTSSEFTSQRQPTRKPADATSTSKPKRRRPKRSTAKTSSANRSGSARQQSPS